MSFSFNFEKDDKISKDDVNTKARTSINANMIDYTRLLPPKKHTLEEMVKKRE